MTLNKIELKSQMYLRSLYRMSYTYRFFFVEFRKIDITITYYIFMYMQYLKKII